LDASSTRDVSVILPSVKNPTYLYVNIRTLVVRQFEWGAAPLKRYQRLPKSNSSSVEI